MQPDLVREVAEAIVQQQLLLNWKFYALMLCVGLVGGSAGYWIAPYLKKRAETFATKADMAEVLRQLSETTRTTEQVRLAIAHSDWAQREWRTTRRVKLEELLGAAYSLDQWLNSQQERWMNGKQPTDETRPMERLQLLATLYFPDLKDEVHAVWMAHQNALMHIVQVGSKAGQARLITNADAYGAALEEFKSGWSALYTHSRSAIQSLENAASKLMPSITGA